MIYLDNCSTTRIRKEVAEIMIKSMVEDFGNPSSLHKLGLRAEKKVKEAREIISSFLKVDMGEIFFTSGGTESNNIAIQSLVNKMANRGNHLITSKIEHPSVLNIMKFYEKKGFLVDYLDVDQDGQISLDHLRSLVTDKTILVSIMGVNNELGTIQPLRQISRIIKEVNPRTFFHVDGVQAFGKIDLDLKDLGIDAYSFSSHKVHGPKGVGGLFIDKSHKLDPIVYGGNQERGLRSGTENLTGIIGFGQAVKILKENFKEEREKVTNLRAYFTSGVQEIDDIRINTSLEKSSPYIVNISFNDTRGEVLLHYLESQDIYVSTTSACSSNGTEKSHVLKAIGLNDKEIEGALRFCLSYENTREDIDQTIEALKKYVKEIRKIILR